MQSKTYDWMGAEFTLKELAEIAGVTKGSVSQRIKKGQDPVTGVDPRLGYKPRGGQRRHDGSPAKPSVERDCKECGAPFLVHQSVRGGQFCSRKCRGRHDRNRTR